MRCQDFEYADGEAKERKLRDRLADLRNVDLYIILNPKTNQMATQEWIDKNVECGENGEPRVKDRLKSKCRIATLQYRSLRGDVHLSLILAPGEGARRVRCVDCNDRSTDNRLAQLLEGYEHLLDDSEGEGDEDGGEMPGDAEGLEGTFVIARAFGVNQEVPVSSAVPPLNP